MQVFLDQTKQFAVARENVDVAPFAQDALYAWHANGEGRELRIHIVHSQRL